MRTLVTCVALVFAAVLVATAVSKSDDEWVEADSHAQHSSLATGRIHLRELRKSTSKSPQPTETVAANHLVAVDRGDSHTTNYLTWCLKCFGAPQYHKEGPAQAVATHDDMKWAWFAIAIGFIGIGAVLFVMGYWLITFTMMFIGFMVGWTTAFTITCGAMGYSGMSSLAASLVATGIACLPGVLVMCLFPMCQCCSVLLIGAAGGLFVALQLNGWIFHFLYHWIGGDAAGYVALGIDITFACIGLLIGCFQHGRIAVVLTTGFGGSYMITWGVLEVIFGNDDDSPASHINPIVLFGGEDWGDEDWKTYAALAAVLAGGFIACVVQFLCTAKHDHDDHKHNDDHDPLLSEKEKGYCC